MAAVDGSVNIDPVAEPGCVHPSASAIDIDMTAWVKVCPDVRILAHHADRQLVGDAVVEAQTDSAGGEVVPLSLPITVHVDKVPEAAALEDFPSASALSSKFSVAPLTFMLELKPLDPL
jgi:hypothetical protein